MASLSMIHPTSSQWMGTRVCLGGSELRPGNRLNGSGHRQQEGAGVGPGTGGQPLGQKPPPPPQQLNQRSQNQRQKVQAQSRAPSPTQEEESYDVLLAALTGLIPSSLLDQVRSSLPKPEKPLTERMMQVQNKLDEEKKAAKFLEGSGENEGGCFGGREKDLS